MASMYPLALEFLLGPLTVLWLIFVRGVSLSLEWMLKLIAGCLGTYGWILALQRITRR